METLAYSFYQMLENFTVLFRADVVPTFFSVCMAWVTSPHPGRMSDLLRILGEERSKHVCSYYRLFSFAKWSTDCLGVGLLALLIPFLKNNRLRVVIDETLLKHRGPMIWGASIFRDAVLSSRKHVVTRWGLNWVVLSVALPNPLREGTFISIPLFARLFLTQEWCERLEADYNSPTHLANEMMTLLLAVAPQELHIRLATDSGYTNSQLELCSEASFTYTGRIRFDASLQYPVWTREYKGRGRRPIYGYNAPKPYKMLRDKRRKRPQVRFTSYRGEQHEVEVVEFIGTYRKAFGTRLMRFIFFQEPDKEPVYLVTSDMTSERSMILEDLVSRWSIEVCFKEAKQLIGVEKSQVWSENAVLRTAPFGFWLLGLVKIWFLQHAEQIPDVRVRTSWYEPEGIPFSQMIATLRYLVLMTLFDEETKGNKIFEPFGLPKDVQKKKSLLLRIFCGC